MSTKKKSKGRTVTKAKSRAVAVHKPQLPVAPKTMLEVIADMSRDKTADVQKFRELLAERRIEQDRIAELAFNNSLKDAQAQMRPVMKTGMNTHTKKAYATLEKISERVDPILRANGFSLSYGMANSPLSGHYRIVGTLRHEAGHSKQEFIDLPIDAAGAKGNENKNATQAAGSTISYGRRYLKMMMLDIAIAGEDNDGAGATGTISDAQLDELIAIKDKIGVNTKNFCEFMKVPSFAEIPAKRFNEAKAALRGFQAGMAKAPAAT